MPRDQYHHGDLAQQARDTARTVLDEHGDAAISLRALARQLGVTPPALYRHFSDRETLLAELAADGFRQLAAALHEVPTEPPRDALIGIGVAYVHFAHQHPNRYRLMFGGGVLPRGVHSRLDDAGRAAFAVLEHTICRARDAGYLRDDQPVPQLTAAAWALVHGLSLLCIDGHLGQQAMPDLLAAQLGALLLDGTAR